MRGYETNGLSPRNEFKSLPQNPTIRTFSSTSPFATTGSATVSIDACPGFWSTSAFIGCTYFPLIEICSANLSFFIPATSISACLLIKPHAKRVGVFRGSEVRQNNPQAVRTLAELHLGLAAHQGHRLNAFATQRQPKGMNYGFSGTRPSQTDRVQDIAFGREAEILRRVVGCVGVVKGASRDSRGPFAICPPGASTVDGLSVRVQPLPDIQKHPLDLIRDYPVGAGPDV